MGQGLNDLRTMLRYVKYFTVTILFTTILINCSRDSDKSSNIKLQVPATYQSKTSALAFDPTYELVHIVLNVSAGDMATVVYSWDAKCGLNCTQPPPPDIFISVPSGPERLIQYLGVYENPATEQLIVTYGDVTEFLNPGVQPITINPAAYGDGASGTEAQVAGQYVNQSDGVNNFGPTGKVAVKFSPLNGSPAMTLFTGEIYNGWFNFFAIEGIPFSYEFKETNEILFADVKPSVLTTQLGNGLLKISAPNVFWRYDTSGQSGPVEEQDGGDLFLGYFGPLAATAGQVCYDDSFGAISDLWQDAAYSNALVWSATASSTSVSLEGGGIQTSSCTGTDYLNQIPFSPNNFVNGIHNSSGFYGPFAKKQFNFSNSDCDRFEMASGCYDGNSVEIQWSYIVTVAKVSLQK